MRCVAESPDVRRFLRHVIRLCFPDSVHELFDHTDGRYATSPLALLDIMHRLQRLIDGGSEYREPYTQRYSLVAMSPLALLDIMHRLQTLA